MAGPFDAAGEQVFEPSFWGARGQIEVPAVGRGSAWFVGAGGDAWVLRHYRRGGSIARLCTDRYLWAGESQVRAFAEWRLLAELSARGLPVPQPIAARYLRRGLTYRCDLITRRIPDAEPLSVRLASAPLPNTCWHAIGTAIASLHREGVYHADLNAHNILMDRCGAVSVIDFDRGRIRRRGPWRGRNLRRLHRSLVKIAAARPATYFAAGDWAMLLKGYASAEAPSGASSVREPF